MAAANSMPEISVVIFQREKWWIAQCLQYDIGAQAHTVEDVLYELSRSIMGHIAICDHHERRPFVDLPAAPAAYWRKFQGTTVRIESSDVPFRIPSPVHLPKPDIRMAA
jgi:hypothetical protein